MTWRPDVVYMHMSHHGSVSRKYCIHKLCMKYKVPDVIHLHGSEFESWYYECPKRKQKKVRDLLVECNNLITLGEEWSRRILAIEPKTHVFVINNTIHIPREMIRWNEKCLNVLFLGVLVKRKGVADLLDAIALYKRKYGQGRMHF